MVRVVLAQRLAAMESLLPQPEQRVSAWEAASSLHARPASQLSAERIPHKRDQDSCSESSQVSLRRTSRASFYMICNLHVRGDPTLVSLCKSLLEGHSNLPVRTFGLLARFLVACFGHEVPSMCCDSV
jgi:hypothetical protein